MNTGVNLSNNTSNKRKLLLLSDICLILVAALWGSSYGVTKLSLQYYPILGFLTIRFGMVVLLLLPVLLVSYSNDISQLKQGFKVGLPLGFILLIIFMFETYGVFYTTASNAAFLISLCLIMTPFLEWIILKNRPHNIVFICAATSLIGTYLLVVNPETKLSLTLRIGDYLILLAALGRGFMVTMTKKLINNELILNKTQSNTQPISSLTLTAAQSLVVFIGSLILFLISSFLKDETIYLPVNIEFWIPTVFLVIFCTIFAFFVQNWAVKIGSPSRASLLMGSEPVFGAIIAILLFQEKIGITGWVGGILITLPSIFLVLKQK